MTNDRRQYQRERAANLRREFFQDKHCARCGAVERLEIHHRNPAEKESHSIWTWGKQRKEAELAKCDVLCEACHLKASIAQMKKPLVHGTYNAYYSYGCRCADCLKGNAERMRKFRARRKA